MLPLSPIIDVSYVYKRKDEPHIGNNMVIKKGTHLLTFSTKDGSQEMSAVSLLFCLSIKILHTFQKNTVYRVTIKEIDTFNVMQYQNS